MSTQEQRNDEARPSEADDTKPVRPARVKPAPSGEGATTPHEGTTKTVDPEELSPDDFE